jgi:hypothetical protein
MLATHQRCESVGFLGFGVAVLGDIITSGTPATMNIQSRAIQTVLKMHG